MAYHKLELEEDFDDSFSVIAIHCSAEPYKLAFLINKHLNLHLQRKTTDLFFSNDGLEISFPIFEYDNEEHYTTYHLIANKCKSESAVLHSSGGLFQEENPKTMVITYLLPKFSKVDYILKIASDFDRIPLRLLIAAINDIKEVISAYNIEIEDIKAINNLIFD